MERRLRPLVTACVVLLAGASMAHAGGCTGRPDGTTCDAGADSAYTMICVNESCVPCTVDPGASPRFIDNGDGTITDRETCLVWEKKDNAGGIHDLNNVYQWSSTGSAMDGSVFTVFLAGLNGAAFAGHRDWRVPTAATRSATAASLAEPSRRISRATRWAACAGGARPGGSRPSATALI